MKPRVYCGGKWVKNLLDNPVTRSIVAPADKRLKVVKFLQHWSAGLHGPGTWHGAGAPQTQRFMFTVLTVFEKKKKMAKKLMGMKKE